MSRVFCGVVLVLSTFSGSLFADFDIVDFGAPSVALSFPVTTGGQPNTAEVVGSALRLTPGVLSNRGIVWTTDPQELATGFVTLFEFEFVGGTGAGGSADGMAFVVQGEGVNAYGDHASAMGYGGFAVSPDNGITNSLAVEFDDFASGVWSDPNGNHISIHTLFGASNSPDETTASIGIATNPPPFGQFTGIHTVMIEYAGGELSVFMDDMTTPQVTAAVDLSAVLGGTTGWIGFTGSGGAAYQVQNILSWSLVGTGVVGPEPEFIRGDCDGSGGIVGLLDGLFLLNYGFNNGATPPCLVAADANGDQNLVALIDGLYVLNFAFNGGAAPPAPGVACGPDSAGVSALGCDTPPCP